MISDDQPAQPLTDAELRTIRAFVKQAKSFNQKTLPIAFRDRERLLAEVDRLRAALTALGRNERAACNRSLSLQEENDRLRKQVQDYHQSADAHVAKFERQHGRLQNAEDRITAVVAIHKPTGINSWGHRTCNECDTPGYYQEWPCPTLVALGFEER